MDEVHLHVTDLDGFFRDLTASVKRIDGGDFTPAPARVGFDGFDTFLKVMTTNRWRLLQALRASGPSSIRALAVRLGRDYRGVHADVSKLLELGLIEKDEAAKIFVPWSRITASIGFEDAA